jgi:hypothetical protein
MVTTIASNSPVLNKPKKPKSLQGVDVTSPTLNKPPKADAFQWQATEGSIF